MYLKRKFNLAVLYGGFSSEREVSLKSGTAMADALEKAGHQVTRIDVQDPKINPPSDIEVAVLALHGSFGEDGQIQQILEEQGIPYTGPGPDASHVAFDKLLAKQAFVAARVPTAEFELVLPQTAGTLGLPFPVVVKPPRQGSSVGVHVVRNSAELVPALNEAFRYDQCALVEEYIPGRELTVGILGDKVLPVVEIKPRDGFYDYANKYTKGQTEYVCPAPLTPEETAKVQKVAKEAFDALQCEGVSRVDIILSSKGRPVVLEINTLPGMTELSLLPLAAKEAGIPFGELCERLVEMGHERYRQRKSKKSGKNQPGGMIK